jgi:hypothetical protein
MKKVNQRIDALLLVGGFSGSGYLFKKVEVSGVNPYGLRRTFGKGHSERDLMYLGTVWRSSKSHCASPGCGYSHGAWRSTIWPSTASSRIFCGCASIIHDEGDFADTLTYQLHAYRFDPNVRSNYLQNRKIS